MKHIYIILLISTTLFANNFLNIENQKELDAVKKAAKTDSYLQYELYKVYKNAVYVNQSSYNAYKWLEKSANNKYPPAVFEMGNVYFEGKLKKHQNIKLAYYWYTQAAKQNNSTAQILLGSFYETGAYVNKDLKKALYWYVIAAKNRNVEAINKLKDLKYNYQQYGYSKSLIEPILKINFN